MWESKKQQTHITPIREKSNIKRNFKAVSLKLTYTSPVLPKFALKFVNAI